MDSVKPAPATNVGGIVRSFAKALRLRTAGIAPDDDRIRKNKLQDKFKDDNFHDVEEDEETTQHRIAMEALLAKLFASISSVKAAYAQLQISQAPYDAEGIQTADEIVVTELKGLSELKQCYLKKQMDPLPEETLLLAEIQELKSVLKTYEIMGKKLESQMKVKDNEIEFLGEKLGEANRQNRLLEKGLNRSGPLSVLDDLHLSGLNPNHFVTVFRRVVKSIQSFVKLVMKEMETSEWDLDAAAKAIEPNVVYSKSKYKCFAFESFVCQEMFDGFQYPNFSIGNDPMVDKKQRQMNFFNAFLEVKSVKPREFLAQNRNSTFGKFCRAKYLRLVHPKLESSFFGDLNQRNLVNSGGCPETNFYNAFVEMAKLVWLLHCLAFSFDPEASIFQIKKGCRFSEVYMETVNHEAFFSSGERLTASPRVAFTVTPGFKVGKTVIQCQVYLSKAC